MPRPVIIPRCSTHSLSFACSLFIHSSLKNKLFLCYKWYLTQPWSLYSQQARKRALPTSHTAAERMHCHSWCGREFEDFYITLPKRAQNFGKSLCKCSTCSVADEHHSWKSHQTSAPCVDCQKTQALWRGSVDELGSETGRRGFPFYMLSPQVLTPSLRAPLLLFTGSVLAQRQPQPWHCPGNDVPAASTLLTGPMHRRVRVTDGGVRDGWR